MWLEQNFEAAAILLSLLSVNIKKAHSLASNKNAFLGPVSLKLQGRKIVVYLHFYFKVSYRGKIGY